MDVELASRMAIYDRIVLFFNLVDGGLASQTIELFAPEASIVFGPGSPKPGIVSGLALHEAMRARQAQATAFTRHLVSTFRFERLDGIVRVSYRLTLFRSDDETRDPGPSFVADVEDSWTRIGGEWLLQSREILPAFYHSGIAR